MQFSAPSVHCVKNYCVREVDIKINQLKECWKLGSLADNMPFTYTISFWAVIFSLFVDTREDNFVTVSNE